MPRTPDRRAGRLEEEEILFDDRTADGDPTDERAMRYVNGSWRMKDAAGVFDPRGTGAALPPATELGQVLYSIDGASFTVQTPMVGGGGWLCNNDGTLLVRG